MAKKWLVTGFLFAVVAIILGAFGAHGLKELVKNGYLEESSLQSFDTGARYQIYHAFAIIVCGILAKLFGEARYIKIAGLFFVAGILLFSGSLYLLSTSRLGSINWNWLGPVTPFGGLCFIAGWIVLSIGIIRKK